MAVALRHVVVLPAAWRWAAGRAVVVQMRSVGGGGEGYHEVVRRGGGGIRDVLTAVDAPGNLLSVLRDLTAAWGVLEDAQVAELVREVAHRQQRAAAGSEDDKKRRLMYTARELFERAAAARHRVEAASYTQLIVCLANCGAASLAEKYFADMKQRQLRPSLLTYTALVKALYSVSHFLRIEEVVCEMQREGMSVEGAVELALLRAYVQEGQVWRACQTVSRKGVQAMSSESVSAMLQGGNLRETMKVFIWMKDRGLVMDQHVYLTLLKECVAWKAPTEAEGVLMMMREDMIPVDGAVLEKVLDVYVATRDPSGVAMTLQKMPRGSISEEVLFRAATGLLAPPDAPPARARVAAEVASDMLLAYKPASAPVLTVLVRVLCAAGDVDGAEALLRQMHRSGAPPPVALVEEVKEAARPVCLADLHRFPFMETLLPGV